ncbi:hypothetical protein C0Q70_08629 [Pomacea canaliculata]|uniref:C-type lectin domain-containing protein n=1 Tax=Pomacea canaliculata TaxID=400727 RepID=A0A2T7P7H8_POMCA|nr:hypothetical protein C0Q70_08629 [Pomacea canaliculata]
MLSPRVSVSPSLSFVPRAAMSTVMDTVRRVLLHHARPGCHVAGSKATTDTRLTLTARLTADAGRSSCDVRHVAQVKFVVESTAARLHAKEKCVDCQVFNSLHAKMELCLEIGGHMVEVDSADENNFLLSIIKNHGATSSWIGLEDFAEEGHFVWSSSQRVPSYTNWAPHVPDDINGNQDCGWITNHPAWWAAGLWDDGYCTDKFNVICERSVICKSSHFYSSPFPVHPTFIPQVKLQNG